WMQVLAECDYAEHTWRMASRCRGTNRRSSSRSALDCAATRGLNSSILCSGGASMHIACELLYSGGPSHMSKLYEALAEAFLGEGVDTQFVLMGDGNMHWSTAFAHLPGVQTIHVRHEHCAVAAATAYNIATGRIAAASVTCGPGLTQLTTALPA